ncbi:MAG: DNA polymerase/3'-5' exonuclease PolX [Candidatus Parvarchaeota archaeon]
MSNKQLADIFYTIADILEIEGVNWKPVAYRKAALSISTLSGDISDYYKNGKLERIEGVGEGIGKKIIEYIKTGKVEKYEELKKKYPIDFDSLRQVRGLGPKKIFSLYKSLGIKNIDDLREAVSKHKLRELEGFGEKTEANLSNTLASVVESTEKRVPLGFMLESAEKLVSELRRSGLFNKVEIAGSTRRMKETIGDLDILATSNKPEEAMRFFTKMKEVSDVLVSGPTKTSVELKFGLNCDLRVVEDESFGSAMQYFTGNKEHNIKLRRIALSKGLKLNEYGIFRGDKKVAGESEEGVYSYLGLDYMPPELREDTGEIEAAQVHQLPKLVQYEEILGDLHTHTNDSDGADSLGELVSEAKKIGLKYIAVTNHSYSLRVSKGLDDKRFEALNRRIEALNGKENFSVLKGVELEILKDGSLDLSSKTLLGMDFVIGALHQNISNDRKTNTDRLIKAIESGKLSAIAHPTDRIIGERPPINLDLDKVFEACEKNDVMLEINGYPTRSDLPFDLVKRASKYRVKFSLGSDSHRLAHLRFLRLATAIARRGWLTKKDVINTLTYEQIIKLKR